MLRDARLHRSQFACVSVTRLTVLALTAFHPQMALAAIIGGEGNRPLADPDWPPGAAAVFHTASP